MGGKKYKARLRTKIKEGTQHKYSSDVIKATFIQTKS